MRYRLRHRTTYAYADAVDLASHMLHLTPRATDHQRVLSAEILCEPAPTARSATDDHFGNLTTWLFVERHHNRLELVLNAVVDVSLPPPPPDTTPWEMIGSVAPWDAQEFTFDSRMAPATAEADAYAAPSFTHGRAAFAAVRDLTSRIRRDFAFKPGVTSISTPVVQVIKQRAGVCQDFSHVMISALRARKIPARYVSGYIRTRPRPGEERRRGADVSHAWVAAWCGPDAGWVNFDPTNDLVVADEHVTLGWGRDYADISPVRGVLLGGGRHTVAVGVDLEAMD